MLLALTIFFIALIAINHLYNWRPSDTSKFYRNGILFMGHRGSPKEEPENTLESYLRATEHGFDAVEMDILPTKDKILVCSHNYDLERETDGDGYVVDQLYSQLTKINAGVKSSNGKFYQMPTLEEVIQKLPPHTILNIEVKAERIFDLHAVKPLVALFRKYNLFDRALVSSFHPLVLWMIKWKETKITTAYLWTNDDIMLILQKPLFVRLVHPDLFHPEAHLVTPQLVKKMHKRGFRINVWTVNNLPSVKWLLDIGVDGIITDHYALMNRSMERRNN